MSAMPRFAISLLEMGFSRRHVVRAMNATRTGHEADTRRINLLVTWLLENPVSDDEVRSGVGWRKGGTHL